MMKQRVREEILDQLRQIDLKIINIFDDASNEIFELSMKIDHFLPQLSLFNTLLDVSTI